MFQPRSSQPLPCLLLLLYYIYQLHFNSSIAFFITTSMAPPSYTRRLPRSSDAGTSAGELSVPRKRWQLAIQEFKVRRRTGLEGLIGFSQIRGQEFMKMLLPILGSMVQRVVSEEMEKAFRQFTTPAPPRLPVGWTQRSRYQLVFMNRLKTVYTMSKLESDEGKAIKVAIVETVGNNQTQIVRFGHLSSAKVEVVVLHGHFNAKNEESWAPEDFNQHIVFAREKSAQLLTGNLTLKLNGGEALLENATFTDNSSFTSTKMFRLGLRVPNASGERVLEGVTEPFRVKERRVEVFEKHYPPMPNDKVWRLDKVRKNGPYHQALSNEGIDSVQKFLRAYMMDEQKLLKIFGKMPESTWKSIIGHAMTCKFGDGLYLHEFKNQDVGLFFDEIYKVVGVKFGDYYRPIDQLDQVEKNSLDSRKREAYQNMGDIQYNYRMVNDQPVLHRLPALGTPLFSPTIPNQQNPNYVQRNSNMGDTPNDQGIVSWHSTGELGTSPGTSNVDVNITRFTQGQLSHDPVTDTVLHYNSSPGALLPGPRITQLQIPQTETTYFGPDGSFTAVPCNFLASQAGELYNCHSRNSLPTTNDVISSMQSQFLLPTNSESFCNNSIQQCNGQSLVQSQQAATGFQPSRVNSFDMSYDELLQCLISPMPNSEGASTPLSQRKWVKIRAALKLAFMGRGSRGLRRRPYCTPPRPRLVRTI